MINSLLGVDISVDCMISKGNLSSFFLHGFTLLVHLGSAENILLGVRSR